MIQRRKELSWVLWAAGAGEAMSEPPESSTASQSSALMGGGSEWEWEEEVGGLGLRL
jgi:hypothetical protein